MIEVKQLVKDFRKFRAVDGVSFTVKKGEVLGFLGPNGAGKSTTMKMLTGFLPATSGSASIGGFNVATHPVEAKRLLGYLPESGPLYQEMTVLEFLRFIADLRRIPAGQQKASLDRVIHECHLESVLDQTIETLSKGYRQRAGLAQALVHNPDYLVLDEPTDGLDPNQKRDIRKLIASMRDSKAIILSTHILEEVVAMCNRVIIIAAGKIVLDDTTEAILSRGALDETFFRLTGTPAAA